MSDGLTSILWYFFPLRSKLRPISLFASVDIKHWQYIIYPVQYTHRIVVLHFVGIIILCWLIYLLIFSKVTSVEVWFLPLKRSNPKGYGEHELAPNHNKSGPVFCVLAPSLLSWACSWAKTGLTQQAQLDYFLSTVLGVWPWSQSLLTHDGLSCSEIGLKTNDRRIILQKNN